MKTKIVHDYNKFELSKKNHIWRALHVSCVGRKAHLQPDRECSDTMNLDP